MSVRTLIALVLMVALSGLFMSMPAQADSLQAAVIPTILPVVAVRRYFVWMYRNARKLMRLRLWKINCVMREICIFLPLLVLTYMTAQPGVLLAAAPMWNARWWNELTPGEKASWTKRSKAVADAKAKRIADLRAKAEAQNQAYRTKIEEHRRQQLAAQFNPANAADVNYRPLYGPIPDKCVGYISRYIKGEDLKTESILTGSEFNKTRDGNIMSGTVFHYAAGVREFVDTRFNEPYLVYTTEDVNDALRTISDGYLMDNEKWHVAIGTVRDGGSTFILVKRKVDMVEFLREVGVDIRITTRAQGNSAAKYLKRILAYHEHMWHGTVTAEREITLSNNLADGAHEMKAWEVDVTYEFDNRTVNHKYLVRPDDPNTDGCSHISVKALNQLLAEYGKKVKRGYCAAITALGRPGEIKGHVLAVGQEIESCNRYDAILIGPKKMLVANDGRWVFGILQSKHHADEVFTDIQSVIHFILEKFLFDWSVDDMQQTALQLQEGKLPRMPETTVLGKVMKLGRNVPGFKAHLIPKLAVKLFELRQARITNANDIRIQIPGGLRRYVIADPHIIREDGSTDVSEALLKDEQVYCSGIVQRIAGHRQPNGHCQEMFLANAVNCSELEWLRNSAVIVFAPAHAVKMLKRMGGGDQDDSVVIYTHTDHVAHFASLPTYPKAERPARPDNPNTKPVKGGVKYDANLLRWLCNEKANQQGIGFFVNKLMVFNYFWSLKLQGKLDNAVWNSLVELYALGQYLEEIVDSVVKTGAPLNHWEELVDTFGDRCTHVPEFLTSRMKKQVGKGTCEIMQTPMDTVLASIGKMGVFMQMASIRYSTSIVARQWNDWDLARKVAYANTLVTPQGRALAERAYKSYTSSLRSAKQAGKDINESYVWAETAFVAQLVGDAHCNEAMAILFLQLHLQYGKNNGQHPTGCLWGMESLELTMKMLEAISKLEVPESFTFAWKPTASAVTVVNDMKQYQDSDPMKYMAWKSASGQTATVLPVCIPAFNGYGEKADGYVKDMYTDTPFVAETEVLLHGEKYGRISPERLNTFINLVRGQKAPSGKLVDVDTQVAVMHLHLPGQPAPVYKPRRRQQEQPVEAEPQMAFDDMEQFEQFMDGSMEQ